MALGFQNRIDPNNFSIIYRKVKVLYINYINYAVIGNVKNCFCFSISLQIRVSSNLLCHFPSNFKDDPIIKPSAIWYWEMFSGVTPEPTSTGSLGVAFLACNNCFLSAVWPVCLPVMTKPLASKNSAAFACSSIVRSPEIFFSFPSFY